MAETETAVAQVTETAVAQETAVVATQQARIVATAIAAQATINAAPPVILIGADNQAGPTIRMDWHWDGVLGPDMYFAVRIGPVGDEHSETWEKTQTYIIPVGTGTKFVPGTYGWHVALVRDLPPLSGGGQDGTWQEITRSASSTFKVSPGEQPDE
jgi:hypothetical protein